MKIKINFVNWVYSLKSLGNLCALSFCYSASRGEQTLICLALTYLKIDDVMFYSWIINKKALRRFFESFIIVTENKQFLYVEGHP